MLQALEKDMYTKHRLVFHRLIKSKIFHTFHEKNLKYIICWFVQLNLIISCYTFNQKKKQKPLKTINFEYLEEFPTLSKM
jgi:hypothetical protein